MAVKATWWKEVGVSKEKLVDDETGEIIAEIEKRSGEQRWWVRFRGRSYSDEPTPYLAHQRISQLLLTDQT